MVANDRDGAALDMRYLSDELSKFSSRHSLSTGRGHEVVYGFCSGFSGRVDAAATRRTMNNWALPAPFSCNWRTLL